MSQVRDVCPCTFSIFGVSKLFDDKTALTRNQISRLSSASKMKNEQAI
ncbi:hypothetical protein TRICHSKD4_4398 [Roseibium sp. TrichSKD4]|nr:hypothetical protein TRICHSKD4_4398 [Roseibium sp. TrichSKD4]